MDARERRLRGVSRILPDLDDDLLVRLFHKGARVQWTSADLDLAAPLRLTHAQREALAHLLTPIYFGEQTAMAGASGILPQLMQARETAAQLYLASFIMDEARHFEALTRLYAVLGYDPLGLRDLPEVLLYHHRLRQGDRVDWVWGILFSDLVGKHFYRSFASAWGDPLLANLSTRILRDESRHLAFAEHYLRRTLARTTDERRLALVGMRDDLYRLIETMLGRLRPAASTLDLDADDYLGRVRTDVEAFGRRIGLDQRAPEPPGPPGPPGPPALPPDPLSPSAPGGRAETTAATATSLSECFGCLLALICGRRLALA